MVSNIVFEQLTEVLDYKTEVSGSRRLDIIFEYLYRAENETPENGSKRELSGFTEFQLNSLMLKVDELSERQQDTFCNEDSKRLEMMFGWLGATFEKEGYAIEAQQAFEEGKTLLNADDDLAGRVNYNAQIPSAEPIAESQRSKLEQTFVKRNYSVNPTRATLQEKLDRIAEYNSNQAIEEATSYETMNHDQLASAGNSYNQFIHDEALNAAMETDKEFEVQTKLTLAYARTTLSAQKARLKRDRNIATLNNYKDYVVQPVEERTALVVRVDGASVPTYSHAPPIAKPPEGEQLGHQTA